MTSGDERVRHKIAVGMCRLVLVRHAAARASGCFQGQRDVPLTAVGLRQLPGLVRKLSQYRIQAVYSSDLARARVTAAAVAREFKKQVESRPGLREMHFGNWQGLSWKLIAKRFPRLSRLWMQRFPRQPIPGAECFSHFKKRVEREWRDIVAANPRRCILVVTHAGFIRVVLASALGMPERNLFRVAQDPCAINVIDHFCDGMLVRCING